MSSDSLLRNTESRISDLQFRLQHLLQPLEDKRLEVKKKSKIYWSFSLSVALLVILVVVLIQPPTIGVIIPFVLVFVGAMIGYTMYVNRPKQELIREFSTDIVPHIVSEFLNNGCYSHESYVSFDEYYQSDLFRESVDRYNGSDLIEGSLGQTSVRFSKLHSEYKTERRDKNGRTRTSWHTIFKGVFMIADSNKHFKGYTYILPDTAERMLGGVGRWLQEKVGTRGRGEMVYMEDPDFEKYYVVYATDPVEARYLLTPNLQQYFVRLLKHINNGQISASFIDGKLYLALTGSFNLFTFTMNKPLNDPETIKYYVENLLQILSVVEILDLNTRVWGK